MDEISNKTLATLLVVAIVISLAGTFFAMKGITTVTNFISGAQTASPSGVAKVNITETVSITLNNPTVDFGNGYRQPTFDDNSLCNLTSSAAVPASCWNVTGTYAPQDFQVENDGNVNVNVTINSTTNTSYFSNCTGSKTYGANTPRYEFAGKLATAGGAHGYGCNTTAGDLTTTNTSFTAANQLLCKNLSATDSADQFNVTIVLGVPKGPTGQCGSTVTFTAAKNYG